MECFIGNHIFNHYFDVSAHEKLNTSFTNSTKDHVVLTQGFGIAKKILRSGYYWPRVFIDVTSCVQKCPSYQIHAPIRRVPQHEMIALSSPWPFAQWGVDLVGPLPIAPGSFKFLIVAVDYFTKWAEAEALTSITRKKVLKFF